MELRCRSTFETVHSLGGQHAKGSIGMQIQHIACHHLRCWAEEEAHCACHIHWPHQPFEWHLRICCAQPVGPSLLHHECILILCVRPSHVDGIHPNAMWSKL